MIKKKGVFIRLDKIGDLICTLPVDQILDESECDITWIVQKGLGSVIDLGLKKRKYLELDKKDPKSASKILKKFLLEFKADVAISFQGPWWVNFELFKARVPIRSGVYSQWHSFLFLNYGLRQKRSKALQHEFEYNKDLVLKTFSLKDDKRFHYFEILNPQQNQILQKFNLESKNYIVVHPGMMGSALNWTQSQYIDFINKKISEQKILCITGTTSDDPYLTDIKKEFHNHTSVRWLQNQLSLKELVHVLAHSEFVLAPSTGVAHLAASVGAIIHGIYSPVLVHHPRRWAPRGPNVTVHVPENVIPGEEQASMLKLKILKEDCNEL